MTLAPVAIDNLTWKEIATAARDRIPTVSRGQWTHHAPVDPGITLLEHYASQLEQRLFWADQFLPQVQLSLLRLAGTEPQHQKCARCIMTFEAKELCRVFQHEQLTNVDGVTGVQFRTVESLDIFPFQPSEKLRLLVDGAERTHRLSIGALPTLIGEQSYAVTKLILPSITRPQIAHGSVELSVFFEIAESIEATQKSISSMDSAESSKYTLCQLQWSMSSADAVNFVPLASTCITDGTLGFRRSGIVKLSLNQSAVQKCWSGSEITSPCIAFRHVGSPLVVKPRIRSIHLNAVIAEHCESVQHTFSNSDLGWKKLPGNSLAIPDFDPENPPIADTICLQLTDGLGVWKHTADLALVGADCNLFQYVPKTASLHFGNGINGRIPIIETTSHLKGQLYFDRGGGRLGNVRKDLKWEIKSKPTLTIRNVTEGLGGSDAETLDDASRRTRIELRRPSRTVTQSDFEQIALTTPAVDISRAFAAIGLHPKCPSMTVAGSITVFVVPSVSENPLQDEESDSELSEPIPDSNMLRAVHDQLQRHRLLTQEVYVEPARYRALSVVVYAASPAYDRNRFEDRVQSVLRSYLHPVWGGPDRRGWPFGGDVFPSELLRVVQNSTEASDSILDIEIEESGSRCQELKLDLFELAALKNVQFKYQNDSRSGGMT